MTDGRGKPVHLTNGERRLLIPLVDEHLAALSAQAPTDDKQRERVRKLRLRQFRRLRRELSEADPTPKTQ